MINEHKRYQEGVIRSILARPDSLVQVIDILDSNDFEDVNYKAVYESILEIYLGKGVISLPEIALKIGEKGGAVNPGWLFNLESNIAEWVQMAPPTTWAKLLKKESAKFKALEVLKEGITEINKENSNPLASMDEISNKLLTVSLEASSEEKFDIKDAVEEFKQETKEMIESGGKIAAITSAYPTLDYYTQGWAPTHLITVGARTGIGKSVFAINNLVVALEQGKSVLFFSLEMTRREVISRIIASRAMIPIQKIEKAAPLTEEEQERVEEALNFIANSKLTIDTNPYVTIEYLKRTSIKQAQGQDGLDFIIIDYLQLISNDGKKNRQEAVAEVSRSVKVLAKELNVPVMVLVQLNRERRDDEADNVPKLHDIRESGAIAQDSNVVILIHRDMDKDSEVIDPKALFILAKNRQGEANKFISVRTRLECSLFIDDNEKGKQVMENMQLAQEHEESGYDQNFDSEAYKNAPSNDDDFSSGLSNPATENYNQMFGSEVGFEGYYDENESSPTAEKDFGEDEDFGTEPDFGAGDEFEENLDNFESFGEDSFGFDD